LYLLFNNFIMNVINTRLYVKNTISIILYMNIRLKSWVSSHTLFLY
jgi:hypothetical protein